MREIYDHARDKHTDSETETAHERGMRQAVAGELVYHTPTRRPRARRR